MQLGGVDHQAEAKDDRKRKRDEEAWRREEKERIRLKKEEEDRENSKSFIAECSTSDDDSGDDADESPSYAPAKHIRKRRETVTLEIPVKQFLDKTSRIADRHGLSYRDRCDLVSNMVQSGGVSLSEVPCSVTTMRK